MADAAPEITAARMQVAATLTGALVQARGEHWRSDAGGDYSESGEDVIIRIYRSILQGLIDAEQ